MDIMSEPVLVLNSGYIPVGIKSVKDAVCMVLLSRATMLKFEDSIPIRSEKLRLPAPRIILLANYHSIPKKKTKISRENILMRDNYTCVYCNKKLPSSKLSIDHIVPRSRWKEIPNRKKPEDFDSWENLATACRECNTRKGNYLISELKWAEPVIRKKNKLSAIPVVSEVVAREYGWSEYLNV